MQRDGFEKAKERRSFFERLMARIPGFRGFSDRKLRREVDKIERDHLADELRRLRDRARNLAGRHTDAGGLAVLATFDRLDRHLDSLAQAVRFADYGSSGLFDAVKIEEPELERLYRFDLSVLDDIARLEDSLAAVPGPGAPSIEQ